MTLYKRITEAMQKKWEEGDERKHTIILGEYEFDMLRKQSIKNELQRLNNLTYVFSTNFGPVHIQIRPLGITSEYQEPVTHTFERL